MRFIWVVALWFLALWWIGQSELIRARAQQELIALFERGGVQTSACRVARVPLLPAQIEFSDIALAGAGTAGTSWAAHAARGRYQDGGYEASWYTLIRHVTIYVDIALHDVRLVGSADRLVQPPDKPAPLYGYVGSAGQLPIFVRTIELNDIHASLHDTLHEAIFTGTGAAHLVCDEQRATPDLQVSCAGQLRMAPFEAVAITFNWHDDRGKLTGTVGEHQLHAEMVQGDTLHGTLAHTVGDNLVGNGTFVGRKTGLAVKFLQESFSCCGTLHTEAAGLAINDLQLTYLAPGLRLVADGVINSCLNNGFVQLTGELHARSGLCDLAQLTKLLASNAVPICRYVRSEQLIAPLVGTVRLVGNEHETALHGLLHTRGGRVLFPNRMLKITQGTIVLNGPLDNAELDIMAYGKARGRAITAYIRGAINDPDVRIAAAGMKSDEAAKLLLTSIDLEIDPQICTGLTAPTQAIDDATCEIAYLLSDDIQLKGIGSVRGARAEVEFCWRPEFP